MKRSFLGIFFTGLVAGILFFLPRFQLRAEDVDPLQGGAFIGGLTVPGDMLGAAERLSLEEATQLALARYLNIQIARLEYKAASYEDTIAEAVYDTEFVVEGTFSNDQSERASTVAGSRELEGIVKTSLEKKIPLGTVIKVEGLSQRNSTASTFTNLAHSYAGSLKFSFEQPLLRNFFGYADRKAISKIKLNTKQFTYGKIEEIEEAVGKARLQYWDLVFAYKNFKARRTALRKAQDFYVLTLEKLDLGLAEKPDRHAAEVNVRKRVLEVLEATVNLRATSNGMKVILNRPEVILIKPETPPHFEPIAFEFERELERAFQSRRDLRQSELEIKKQEVEFGITRNSLLPELKFEGHFAGTSLDRELASSQGEVIAFNHPDYFAGVKFSVPFERRKEHGEFEQARLNLEKFKKELARTRLNIRSEIDNSLQELNLAVQKVIQSGKIEELERKKLDEEFKNFQRGRSETQTILDYQEDLIEAEVDAISALVEHRKAMDNFYREQNRLLEAVGVTRDQAMMEEAGGTGLISGYRI